MIPDQFTPASGRPPADSEPGVFVACPLCRRAVAHPGLGRDGDPALAECRGCDLYFSHESESIGSVALSKGEVRPCP